MTIPADLWVVWRLTLSSESFLRWPSPAVLVLLLGWRVVRYRSMYGFTDGSNNCMRDWRVFPSERRMQWLMQIRRCY